MKIKFLLATLFVCCFITNILFAQQCSPGTGAGICTPNAAFNTPGIYPVDTGMPCIVDGIAFDTVIQIHLPATASGYTLDHVTIQSITNLPCGLCWAANSTTINGNSTGCIRIHGTSYDAPGEYQMQVSVNAYVNIGIVIAAPGNPYNLGALGLKYYLRVRVPNAACPAVDTASAGLTATPHGTITAPSITGSSTVCSGGSTTLTATGASYYGYVWSTGANTASINVTAAGTYSVTVFNNCTSATASKTITVSSVAANITAAGPTTFCQGDSVVLNANTGTGLTYHWSNNATTASITARTGGNYTVTVTNASSCSVVSSPITVTVNALPTATITASGATTICAGDSVILTASAGTGYTYHWSNNATSQNISVTQPGNYAVTVTSNNCNAVSTATNVIVNSAPAATVTASGTTTLCQGDSVTLTANTGTGLTYHWSNNATSQSITVNQAGTYKVTVTNTNNCSAVSSGTIVTVNALPIASITAGGATTFCQGDSVVLSANAGTGLTYHWSNNATTQSITAIAAGTYKLTVTNASNCSAVSSGTVVTVNANPAATITASGAITLCQGDSVTLNANTGTGLTYHWSNNASSASITVNQAGTFKVTVTNANNCSAVSAGTVVTVNALPLATITPSGATTFCQGDSVTLSANTGAGLTYHWSNNAITQSITVTQANSYKVTVTNASNCSAVSSAIVVTVNANPTASISASGPTSFCEGDSVTLTANTGTGLTYHWSTNATSQAITANQTGNYTVTVTNANNCSAVSSSVAVTANALPSATITPNGPTTFCQGGNVVLNANAGSGYTYRWSNASTNQSITVTQNGTFKVTVTNASNCAAVSSTVTAVVNPTTNITTEPSSQATCLGGNVSFSVGATGNNLTYQWLKNGAPIGITTATYNIPSAALSDTGSYKVIVTGLCGNDTSVSASLSVTTNLTFSQQPATQVVCLGHPATFTVIANGTNATFQWLKNGNNINGANAASYTINAVSPTDTGSYSCYVTSNCGDSTSQSARLNINLPSSYSYSYAICPGGSYNFHGQVLTSAGTYIDTVTATNNCDSVVTLQLSVTQALTSNITTTICTGATYDFNGQQISTAGTYVDTLHSAFGCDSIVTLNLSILPTYFSSVSASICSGDSYLFNGHSYNSNVIHVDTLHAVNGCDSVTTLTLTILPVSTSTIAQTICQGQSFEGHSSTGTFVDTFRAANTCDSIRTLNLTVLPVVITSFAQTICQGQSFDGYNATGIYVDTFTAANTCDSIRTLDLTVLQNVTSTINAAICTGQNYGGHNAAGTYIDTFAAANTCDSIRTLNLTVNTHVSSTVAQTICQGTSLEGYSQTGTFVDTFVSGGGCDSIRTLNLTVTPFITNTITQTICNNQSFAGHNTTGTFVDTFLAANGCDSLRTLNLTVLPAINTTDNQTICGGNSYGGHSTNGVFTDTLIAAGGCDSVRTLMLQVLPTYSDSVKTLICFGDTLNGHSVSGFYVDSFHTVAGCDSIISLSLSIAAAPTTPVITQHGDTLFATAGAHYQWYAGTNLDTLLAGDTLQAFIFAHNGDYGVAVWDSNGCKATSAAFNAIHVGIEGISDNHQLNVFPNPTTGILAVELKGIINNQPATVQLFDVTGVAALVKTWTPTNGNQAVYLDLSNLPEGLYLLHINQGGWDATKRVIIAR